MAIRMNGNRLAQPQVYMTVEPLTKAERELFGMPKVKVKQTRDARLRRQRPPVTYITPKEYAEMQGECA